MIPKKKSEEKNIHETKLKILDTAEKLFALYGFEATSIRNIINDAGLSVALVNYHFGSKEALIIAVLNRILIPLEQERLQELTLIKKQYPIPPIEAIMRAFINPFFKLVDHPYYLALIGRSFFELPLSDSSAFSTELLQTQDQFEKILLTMIPDINQDNLHFKLTCILGMIRHLLALSKNNTLNNIEQIKSQLIQYAVAILITK